MGTNQRAVFHLSFPVSSLAEARAFYEGCLGARIGRVTDQWVDIIVFGHQVTIHEIPMQVLPRDARGVRHFGAILAWEQWETVRNRVLAFDPSLEQHISHRAAGTRDEHVKLLLEDPDGNAIEIKAYREIASIAAALGEV